MLFDVSTRRRRRFVFVGVRLVRRSHDIDARASSLGRCRAMFVTSLLMASLQSRTGVYREIFPAIDLPHKYRPVKEIVLFLARAASCVNIKHKGIYIYIYITNVHTNVLKEQPHQSKF